MCLAFVLYALILTAWTGYQSAKAANQWKAAKNILWADVVLWPLMAFWGGISLPFAMLSALLLLGISATERSTQRATRRLPPTPALRAVP
jgi:TRAP-type C4-dicarboxylate transport system permease small subunit